MDSSFIFILAADAMLILHVLFVGFVTVGFVLILVGKVLNWSWVRNLWFRTAHLAAIGVVVIHSWLGVICPFTTWEMASRSKSGDTVYTGTFISHWLETILYYQAPAWIFVVCYTAFGSVVVAAWYLIRPSSFTAFSNNGSK